MPDPFSDPEFQERLRKLLRMLASDQEQEADTARRKLLSHLAQHELSANDLADRLAGPPSEELEAARAAVRHAEQHAARADARRQRAEAALAETGLAETGLMAAAGLAETRRGRPRRGRGLRIALALLLVVLPCAGVAGLLLYNASGPNAPGPAPSQTVVAPMPLTTAPLAALPPAPAVRNETAMFSTGGVVREVRQPAEWSGTVLVAGTELRSDMRPDAIVLATLQAGTRVTVQRTMTYQGMEWLQVSTADGPGFVPVGRVRRLD